MATKTVVFIHGMYMTPLCWEGWVKHFSARGYRCVAPSWPLHDLPPAELRRRHPDPALANLTLSEVVARAAQAAQDLGEKPVVVGHSMGGLVVQLLLQQGLAAAGVAIHSAPPQGVLVPSWPFLKANWPHANPLAPKNQPVMLSQEQFNYAFVNGLPAEQQRAAYERYAVPESRRVPAESLTPAAKIDFAKPHPPLLFVAGSADHTIPAALNRANHARYRQGGSVTEYREFPGRTHFTLGQDGWQEVAGYALDWLGERVG